MDNFGGEIGQKMRSAVKAKLIELGTGAAGYIDDELPDYVMIMVANKRSKQQMITDLNLFLADQTELFVTWLHEVLQKLQEVTLPAVVNIGSSKKRKAHQTKEEHSKKDKKTSKKDKRNVKQSEYVAAVSSPEVEKVPSAAFVDHNAPVSSFNSITDVFAEEFLEKAKHTLDVELKGEEESKSSKNRLPTSARETISKKTNEFDIPTISEISSTTEGVITIKPDEGFNNTPESREKDLAELAEIQRKIHIAKRHLRARGQLPVEDETFDNESLDKDYLNIKYDACADFSDENEETVIDNMTSTQVSLKSPIIFDIQEEEKNRSKQKLDTNKSSITLEQQVAQHKIEEKKDSPKLNQPSSQKHRHISRSVSEDKKKLSVHERLGLKPRVDRTRQVKELYVPAHRRKEHEKFINAEGERLRLLGNNVEESRQRLKERQSRERDRNKIAGRDRRRENIRQRRTLTPDPRAIYSASGLETSPTPKRRPITPDIERDKLDRSEARKRVVSHVIVAPSKVIEPSDDEDLIEKPVNSIIKIKPRQPVSPSKQACKNLLLRAVADAQRSTIQAKKIKTKKVTTQQIGKYVSRESEAIQQHTYCSPVKKIVTGELFRRTTRNIVVDIESPNGFKLERKGNKRHKLQSNQEPDKISETGVEYAYIPKKKNKKLLNDENNQDWECNSEYEYKDMEENSKSIEDTQFVVTLNDDKANTKYKRTFKARSTSASPLPQVTSSSMSTQLCAKTSSMSNCSNNLEPKKLTPVKEKSTKTLKKLLETVESPTSSQHNNTPPIYRSELIEIYRKPKEISKIIIKPDTDEEDEMSCKIMHRQKEIKHALDKTQSKEFEEGSLTPPLPPNAMKHLKLSTSISTSPNNMPKQESVSNRNSSSPQKRRHVTIKFDLDNKIEDNSKQLLHNSTVTKKQKRSKSKEHSNSPIRKDSNRSTYIDAYEEHKKINTRIAEDRKYDNIPSLSSVPVDTSSLKTFKPKERCIYHPNCTKNVCEFYHPSAPCKSFPNCKYGDKCMYTHPKCKYDMACINADCNYMHTGQRNISTSAPPLTSHVVPVQTYKSISAVTALSTSSVMCKYYPNCTKVGCTFYHPKPCRFGKNCINKLECNFYHHEVQSCNKFKWVAQTG